MTITNNNIEIYLSDLNEDAQKKFIEVYGDNGNYDVFPIIEIPIEAEL